MDWSVKYYNVETLQRVRQFKLLGIPVCSASVDSNTVYVGGYPATLSVIDARSPKPIFCQIGDDCVNCMEISNPNEVVVGSRSGKVHIYDIRGSKERFSFMAHES